jgi:hypothetical protein
MRQLGFGQKTTLSRGSAHRFISRDEGDEGETKDETKDMHRAGRDEGRDKGHASRG